MAYYVEESSIGVLPLALYVLYEVDRMDMI